MLSKHSEDSRFQLDDSFHKSALPTTETEDFVDFDQSEDEVDDSGESDDKEVEVLWSDDANDNDSDEDCNKTDKKDGIVDDVNDNGRIPNNLSDEGEDVDEGTLLAGQDSNSDSNVAARPKKVIKPLTPEALEAFKNKQDKTGIIYLSRIPPFMKPQKLRHLLQGYGDIGRIYLAPEDSKTAIRRKKYRGNKRKNFTEGWVEFKDKSVAKKVALMLNNQTIGGKKSHYYHDDIWNIKYLPKFKWMHLTEQIAYEKAQKEQRLRAEILQAKRENKLYLANVSKAKMIQSIEGRKKRKAAEMEATLQDAKPAQNTTDTVSSNCSSNGDDLLKIRRRFKQRKIVEDPEEREDENENLRKVKGVLSKVGILILFRSLVIVETTLTLLF
ncbi:hypothetical protein BKA69DRAFT_1029013 [Paraphysoderma sedebokerense]|nr:hypothetical protein BKA69DRAFT_1029013 [Paraphysoderma sedebokerense]